MLSSIAPYVARYCQVIATVTGINVEVADTNLIRIAGTGMYAEGTGASIRHAGEMYRHVLQASTTFIMKNPRKNALCRKCSNLPNCRETFSICTPIVHNGRPLGIIGMICFTDEERERMVSNLAVYKDFVEQMAQTLTMVAAEHQKGKQTQHMLDTFLQITDLDHRGVMTLTTQGSISYLNDKARETLEVTETTDLHSISLRSTGSIISDMEEYEVRVDGTTTLLMGKISELQSEDPTFHHALVFDTLPHYTKMLSQFTHGTESSGLKAIVGESQALLELKQKVLQIARTSSTVLITGESGTGKEMFARAIHASSDRRNEAFIPINCGAIPDALLESELFGYVGGAFTGASPSGYIGKFEFAHKGILFLDEIGAMPLYLQVKLLRVLQDMRITRLGSNRTIDVDVRIIAATNDFLPKLIEQRMFRDDLYYRLNVIPLRIPPLRERTADIPALASFFLEKYCRLFSKKLIRPTPRLLDALTYYAWPGNVREFENIMEYLVNIIPEGGSATVGMLPSKIREAAPQRKGPAATQNITTEGTLPHYGAPHALLPPASPASTILGTQPAPVLPLAELEKKAITQALQRFGMSAKGKQQAANALGIGIATLYRKIKEYAIEEKQ